MRIMADGVAVGKANRQAPGGGLAIIVLVGRAGFEPP